MNNELSAIPLQPQQIKTVTDILSQCGMSPHFFQNLEAWEENTVGGKHGAKPDADTDDSLTQSSLENCLLLVGPFSEILKLNLPARIQVLQPGLPVVAVGESPSLKEVVQMMRQGVTDVVDLRHEPNGFCNTVSQAISRGRGNAAERIRVRSLRRRLSTLTAAEREVLESMLSGLANKETAKKLSIGLRTVELRRAKLMAKMGAKSVAELVKLFCEARCPGVDARATA